jgi:hypothetical protein
MKSILSFYYFMIVIYRVADQDPHYFWKLDPDSHSSEHLDPGPRTSKNSGVLEAQNGALEGLTLAKEAPNGALFDGPKTMSRRFASL